MLKSVAVVDAVVMFAAPFNLKVPNAVIPHPSELPAPDAAPMATDELLELVPMLIVVVVAAVPPAPMFKVKAFDGSPFANETVVIRGLLPRARAPPPAVPVPEKMFIVWVAVDAPLPNVSVWATVLAALPISIFSPAVDRPRVMSPVWVVLPKVRVLVTAPVRR